MLNGFFKSWKIPLNPDEYMKMRIPEQSCHPFRFKVATYSGPKLPPIPEINCHFLGVSRNIENI